MSLSQPFADVLAAGRQQFNRRVAEARHRFGTFDAEALGAFLKDVVDPIVVAVARSTPSRVPAVAAGAYELAVELVGQSLVGPAARSTAAQRAWQDLAPAYWRQVADQPLQALGLLTNAAINVEKVTDPSKWLATMARLAPAVETMDQMRRVGQVAAWCGGLAHYRNGALRAASELPEPLAIAAIGASTGTRWTEIRPRLESDPWFSPHHATAAERHAIRVDVGAFTGLGGTFSAPPEIRATAEGFLVRSADRYGLIIADAFGAVLHAATAEDYAQGDAASAALAKPASSGSAIEVDRRRIELDLPAEGLHVAHNEHTLAISSPWSFAVRLVPRR